MAKRLNEIEYFNREKNLKNPIFLDRFPNISFNRLKVLDLGCGVGALSIDLALKGAKEVLGVDIEPVRVNAARKILREQYPELENTVHYECINLKDLADNDFDIIISKASFEHIINLDVLLMEMKNKLKMGGKIVTGFGPLYNTPWGDHHRLQHKLPWTHVIFGERHFIEKLNKRRIKQVDNIYDLGLNGYSLKEYKNMLNNVDGMSVVDFRTNVSDNLSMKLFNLFTYLPFMEEYFTYNIYCVLERTN